MPLLEWIPYEIEEKILMYLSPDNIRTIGKDNVSEYVWCRKKHRSIDNAARDGNLIGLRYLAEICGDNIHIYNDEALRLSAENGHLEIVQYLVGRGANINLANGYALHYSAGNGHLEVVIYLVEHGANLYAKALTISASNGHIWIVKYLVEKCCVDINSTYALHYSADNGHLEVVRYLVERGADIHKDKEAALVTSAARGQLEVVKYFIEECGADIYANDNGVLRYSVIYGHLHIVKYLAERGANIQDIDNLYHTFSDNE
jgi:hypothetical protein